MSTRNGSPDTGGGDSELLRKALKAEAPVIFYINGIGDNILNLPALRALGALFAGRLSLICSGSDSLFMFADLPLKRVVTGRHFVTEGPYSAGTAGVVMDASRCWVLGCPFLRRTWDRRHRR